MNAYLSFILKCKSCRVISLFKKDQYNQKQINRVVYLNNEIPTGKDTKISRRLKYKYPGNKIKTSKYNLISFFPKNLFEQLRRIANFYFLINIILKFITPEPPLTNPYAGMVPLAIVVIITAIKQGYEDILRHLSDCEINNTKTRVIRNGKFIEVKWSNIVCGDIVEVTNDKEFPSDLVLLHTDNGNRECHITTANLDGESNLKTRKVPNGIPSIKEPIELSSLRGSILFDLPNKNLYEFKGKLIINRISYPLTNENLLLRGTRLKITKAVFGCVVYAGKDTKIMLNSKFMPNKLSCVERRLNRLILIFLVLLTVLVFISFGLTFYHSNKYKTAWYLDGTESKYFKNKHMQNFIAIVFYLTLYNNIIPISMYVTLEIQRFIGSKFIQWDDKLYDDKLNEPAKANNSDINEDLGQIEFLFSDKTGTLTENQMIFKKFAIDGVIYEEEAGQLFNSVDNTKELSKLNINKVSKFLEIMVLCHTVNVDSDGDFQASSPDEFCFLQLCEKIGIIYLGEEKINNSNKIIRRVDFLQHLREYELLHVLEFDSKRKRMSIIIRCLQSNEILLFTKGAEDSIFKCCIAGDVEQCDRDITNFSILGWRTLAFAYRVLSLTELEEYDHLLMDAYNDINLREEKLSKAFDIIETKLILVGATGIEDRLQEDCDKTLAALRRAGIKIWVLTGDKKETALNISNSCKHFSADMVLFNLTAYTTKVDFKQRLDEAKNRLASKKSNEKFSLVIDGKSLVDVLIVFSDEFLEICLKCDAVLCCRMSPSQKASIVNLVKNSKDKPVTAAIGDGANDVSMIQVAHVGFGIYGKEGRNAARAADFSFGKFKHLERIILVHGYLFYTRTSSLVSYFFYKNVAFVFPQFYYAFFNAFSIQSLFNTMILTFYNLAFTSAPIFFYGLFEKRISIKTLEKNTYLYRFITKNYGLSRMQFLKWNLFGVYHSAIAFFFSFGLYFANSHFDRNGKMSGFSELGSIVITIIYLVVHLKLIIETRNINWFIGLGNLLSLASYVLLFLLPNAFIMSNFLTAFTDHQNLYWINFDMFSHLSVWFCIIGAIVASLLPDLVLKIFDNLIERNKVNKLRETESWNFSK